MDQLLFRPEEAAKMLGIGRSKLYELLAAGELESVRVGACRRIPRDVLDDFVRRLRTPGNSCGNAINSCANASLGAA